LTALLLVAAGPALFGERIVRQAIVNHPDILVEGSDALRDRQYAPTLAAQRANIETPFHSSWKGAAKPDVTLAYYYDYACGYCRKSNPDLDRLLAEDKGLRVVFHELPILGPSSLASSRVALAASKAGRFAAFHDTLNASGNPTPESLAKAAAAAGVSAQPQDNAEQKRRSNATSRSQGSLARPVRHCSSLVTG
jgi:protein-disulfide isomerase